ncbi:Glyoxalase-like domain protein [Planctomycetes bacterium Pan216]|uniref:Glyoxalase-like domain protein n=1 Tax=Kolteria novifilia TaxID=2527975 RepID=A0A518B7A5_9BACT|nr:Glyoxalase-like domain protein [Planctomycetes bacterium Pan216]
MRSNKRTGTALDEIDHVAIEVKDIAETVSWYTDRFQCEVVYRDNTWAMLEFGNIRLAFVSSGQHPPHLGFVREDAEEFGTLETHRDGTRSTYIADPSGNAIELLAKED